MTPEERSALDARRLHNYLRMMEKGAERLKDVADKLANEGKIEP